MTGGARPTWLLVFVTELRQPRYLWSRERV